MVVGNPPYQGLSKTERFGYVAKKYPRGKADLYAAFLERGLELVREGGTVGAAHDAGMDVLGAVRGTARGAICSSTTVCDCLATLIAARSKTCPTRFLPRCMSVILNVHHPMPWRDRHPADAAGRSLARFWQRTDPQAGGPSRPGRPLRVRPEGLRGHRRRAHRLLVDQGLPRPLCERAEVGGRHPVTQGLSTGEQSRFIRICWDVAAATRCELGRSAR